ncbi:type II secretion system protein E [Betaproteobacteria bacterium]|nr:type II secretion system protein E [Betaproteobacteria bacterium]
MNAPRPAPAPIGQTLLASGVIGEDQLRIVLHEQRHGQHRPFGQVCVELGFISEAVLRDALSARLGHRAVDLAGAVVDPAIIALVPAALARRHCLLPIGVDADILSVAMPNPHDVIALDALSAHCGPGLQARAVLAAESDIRAALDRHYGYHLAIDDILRELETAAIELPHDGGERHPVMRLIDALLVDAVKNDASDIHFEPEAGFLRIRYRIDGILHPVRALHANHWAAMAVRLKVLAGLNIAETRAPQDGRISLTIAGRPIDFRLSTLPTLHGENIVLRVLDRQRAAVALEKIGFDISQLKAVERMLARPEGLILVTGPTGSGKTTTLYAMLDQLNTDGVNIMTLEDPVEYPMPRLRQTTVSEAARIDFASGIRALLRQDPDIMLVGEIRDVETAELAIRAAMTGHRVFATLHTNNAIGAIPRLFDLGVPPGLLAGNLVGVIAQRLLRRLCPHCRTLSTASADEQKQLGRAEEPVSLAHPAGCPECGGRGYRGRLPVFEVLETDDAFDELIATNAPVAALARCARNRGHRALADDGLRRVIDGSTSPAEFRRVIGSSRGSPRHGTEA